MNNGPDTDIISGKPKEIVSQDKAKEKEKKDTDRLQHQAECLGLSQNPDGKKLIELVEGQLIRRIDELVAADPKATAFTEVLFAIGINESLAKKAVQKLIDMKIKKD
jgi:hypothetical protein